MLGMIICSSMAAFSIAAQAIRFQVEPGISYTGSVDAGSAYRAEYSTDLTSWARMGDAFLPSERIPWEFPEGPQGFVRLIPDFPLDDFEPRVVLLGDSTMADLSALSIQYHGWGQHFADFFEPSVTMINLAEAGMGTSEYFARKKTQTIELLRPDFVIMQFGHIEQKQSMDAGQFEQNLTAIIAEIREIGTVPVLVTPVAIRHFTAADQHVNELSERRQSVLKVARANHVQCVDLNKASADLYARMGNIPSAFITVCGNECDDLSHFSSAGSYVVAAMVAEALPELLQIQRIPLDDLVSTVDSAFENDRHFSSLSTPFVELTGFQDEQIWEWLFPSGTVPVP
jgi:lysophospholipase L1-like esterase